MRVNKGGLFLTLEMSDITNGVLWFFWDQAGVWTRWGEGAGKEAMSTFRSPHYAPDIVLSDLNATCHWLKTQIWNIASGYYIKIGMQ